MRKERCHCSFPYCQKLCPFITACLILWKSGARVLNEKREASRGFSKISYVEPHPSGLGLDGAWDPPFWDLISTSPMISSTIPILPCLWILAHPPWKKDEELCCIPTLCQNNSWAIGGKVKLEATIYWKEISTPRHQGFSLSNNS